MSKKKLKSSGKKSKLTPKKAKASVKVSSKKSNKKVVSKKASSKVKVVKKIAKKSKPAPAKKTIKKVAKKTKPSPVKKKIVKQIAKKAVKKPVKKLAIKKIQVVKKVVPVKVAKPTKEIVKKVEKVNVKATVSKKELQKIATMAQFVQVDEVSRVIPPNAKPLDKSVAASIIKDTPKRKSKSFNGPRKIVQHISQVPTFVDLVDEKNKKEPAGKFELEYVVHSSAPILYEFLTTPSGLSEWFCDDVDIRNGIYSFKWDGSEQRAKVIRAIPEKVIRFQWIEKSEGLYFELRIEKDELTNDISLMVVDFAENEEYSSSKLLWDTQIEKLMQVLGSFA